MDKVRLEIDGDSYWIEGGDFDDMLSVIRNLPGRKFDRDEKCWKLVQSPGEVARAVKPFLLMYRDDDELADSTPIQVSPD